MEAINVQQFFFDFQDTNGMPTLSLTSNTLSQATVFLPLSRCVCHKLLHLIFPHRQICVSRYVVFEKVTVIFVVTSPQDRTHDRKYRNTLSFDYCPFSLHCFSAFSTVFSSAQIVCDIVLFTIKRLAVTNQTQDEGKKHRKRKQRLVLNFETVAYRLIHVPDHSFKQSLRAICH